MAQYNLVVYVWKSLVSGRYFSTRDSNNDQWGRNYEIHGTNGGSVERVGSLNAFTHISYFEKYRF